jgi:hypothetical protein
MSTPAKIPIATAGYLSYTISSSMKVLVRSRYVPQSLSGIKKSFLDLPLWSKKDFIVLFASRRRCHLLKTPLSSAARLAQGKHKRKVQKLLVLEPKKRIRPNPRKLQQLNQF